MLVEEHLLSSTESWLKLRKQDVTASDAAALLGVHPYRTLFELYALKTGRVEPESDNPLFRRGHVLEPAIATALRWDFPSWTVDYPLGLYFRDPESRVGATPDARCRRPDRPGVGVVQFKSVGRQAFADGWLDPDTREVVPPLWIGVQVAVEAMLSKADWAAIAALVVDDTATLEVVDVDILPALYHRVAAEARDFWALVDSGEEPPIDWERDGRVVEAIYAQSEPYEADLRGDAAFADLLTRRADAARRRAEADAEIANLNPQIIRRMGNAEKAVADGFRVSARTVRRDAAEIAASTFRSIRTQELTDD